MRKRLILLAAQVCLAASCQAATGAPTATAVLPSPAFNAATATVPPPQLATATAMSAGGASELSAPTVPPSPTGTPAVGTPTLSAPTATPMPVDTPVVGTPPLRAPTLTPAPTEILPHRTPSEAMAVIGDLLAPVPRCRLPCLLNIVPEKSAWDDVAVPLRRTFRDAVGQAGGAGYVDEPLPYSGGKIRGLYVSIYGPPWHDFMVLEFPTGPGLISETIMSISSGPYDIASLTNAIDMQHVLNDYGQPDEIWVGSTRTGEIPHDFTVVLFYGRLGFYAAYEAESNWKSDRDNITTCFLNIWEISIRAWNPATRPKDFSAFTRTTSVVRNFGPDLQGPSQFFRYRPLAEATGMSVAEFFGAYRRPNPGRCLATPRDLWY